MLLYYSKLGPTATTGVLAIIEMTSSLPRPPLHAWATAMLDEGEGAGIRCMSLEGSHVAQLCHGVRGGVVVVDSRTEAEWSILLRVGGPHPQTRLFRRASNLSHSLWMASFHVCERGQYTLHVRSLMQMPFAGDSVNGDPLQRIGKGSQPWLKLNDSVCLTKGDDADWVNVSRITLGARGSCNRTQEVWRWKEPFNAERVTIQRSATRSLSTVQIVPHPWKALLPHYFGELTWSGDRPHPGDWPAHAPDHVPAAQETEFRPFQVPPCAPRYLQRDLNDFDPH